MEFFYILEIANYIDRVFNADVGPLSVLSFMKNRVRIVHQVRSGDV